MSQTADGLGLTGALVRPGAASAPGSLRSFAGDGFVSDVVRGKCAPGQPGRALAEASWMFATRNTSAAARQAVPGGGDFCGGEERRTSVGARSALRDLTRRSCSSAASEANAASSATRLKAEHRSGVGVQRRPPQHEPSAGSACRAAPTPRRGGHPRKTATGRERPASAPMVEGVVPRERRGGPTE